jgi:hypothetical protein
MDKVINTQLLRNPFNWLTVYLMVMFGALAVKVLFPPADAPTE